jgi:sugar phosphate isomerase/epimerase
LDLPRPPFHAIEFERVKPGAIIPRICARYFRRAPCFFLGCESSMQPLRIGVATREFRQPLKQSLKTAAEMGAQGVQFDVRNELKPQDLSETGRRHFLHTLSELEMKVASLHLPTRRTFYDLEYLDARLAATREAMQFAWQLESRVVTLRVGRIPSDPDSPDYLLLRQVLGDLARFGNHVGVTLALIPTNDAPASLQQLVAATTEGILGVDFDPAAFVLAGHDPGLALRTLHASIVHMLARDAIRDVDGAGLEVSLGRGEVDWNEFVAIADEMHYHGWITVDRTQGDNRILDSAHAVQYLKEIALQ